MPEGAFRPNVACLDAGDQHAMLQLRCYAAAGLSDVGIRKRAIDLLDAMIDPQIVVRHDDAAIAIARHAALVGLPARRTACILARLSVILPGGVDDPECIAAIVRCAHAEVG